MKKYRWFRKNQKDSLCYEATPFGPFSELGEENNPVNRKFQIPTLQVPVGRARARFSAGPPNGRIPEQREGINPVNGKFQLKKYR